jgi:hypothetical protein
MTMEGWPGSSPALATMPKPTKQLGQLYQLIERIENHTATMSVLLEKLQEDYMCARGDDLRRAKIEREIAYYVAERAKLHAERDRLRRQVTKLREQ